ncbi:centrosomal protein of 68 kDa [Tamandua tetradactyla]|uniref:centrosomal protein of 68 kDa n=1 Tax=Tamandua tetradactyla TaxID=48850 RepID=UPI004053F571
MALGEEKAEVEASSDTKAQSYGRWSCSEQEVHTQGTVRGDQPPRLEAEGGPASPMWEAEGLPAPACWDGSDSSSRSGASQSQANTTNREPVAGGSKPAFGCLLPPASMGTGDLLRSVGNQLEETSLPASEELPQILNVPRTTAHCSGHDADTEDDPSPVESSRVPSLSQQLPISGVSYLSRWKSMVSPAAPPLSSYSVSASSPVSSFLGHQKKMKPQSCALTKVSSMELVVPQPPTSVVGPGPQLHWLPQAISSAGDAPGQGRKRLSFQAEYWACVLPDSLPPSPDRHSPLWNPNKEYEDLLDYTYPLKPKPQISKHPDNHVLPDPVLQDSGIDLDSFSVSPASTLKSPTNVSQSCPSAEASALPFSGPQESSLQWPYRMPQKPGSMGLAPCSQLTSTPRAPGSRDAAWGSRESTESGSKEQLPMARHRGASSPKLRTLDRGWPSPKPEKGKRASQSALRPDYTESGWKSEEEVESEEEYLALPSRLTQVSSLISYLGSVPTLVNLPSGATRGQSSLEVSDSDGPSSVPSESTRSQPPSGAVLPGPRGPAGQKHCLLRSFICARDSAGEGSLMSSQAPGIDSGLMRTHSSFLALSDQLTFSDPDTEGRPPRKGGELGKESLVHCVKTFCCQLEELIRWLYSVADATNNLIPPKSSLTGLKSSLKLYRQFKKDIDEHQFLTESVLQKGEILLQCLLDNTPVLKDVLERIAEQSGELESHADRLYDSILASLDMLAGCTLLADKPVTAKQHGCKGL